MEITWLSCSPFATCRFLPCHVGGTYVPCHAVRYTGTFCAYQTSEIRIAGTPRPRGKTRRITQKRQKPSRVHVLWHSAQPGMYVLAVVYRTVHPASSRVWRSSIPTAQRALVVPNGILRPSRRTHPVSNSLLSILIPMLAPAAYEQKRAQLWRKLFPSHHTPMAIGNPVY